MQLAQPGVITGKYKTLHRGKIVGSFAAGSQELFEFMNNNPQIEMHPSEYTNSPFVIAQHDNMVAINSALEIDLTGQVVADSLGSWFYSGIGGHADFIRGAAMAKNGKPIIAMPSTATRQDGLRSRIVATLSEGAGVTTTRGDTHYVVTEYGVAYLHGRNMRERAMSLINIAHPDFRGELLHAAKRRRIVYANQIMPPTRNPYPAAVRVHGDAEGRQQGLRPADPSRRRAADEGDVLLVQRADRYLRYHGPLKSMPHNKLQVFCNVDYDEEMALIGTIGEPGSEEVIGVGRYMHDAAKNTAEVAFVVRDDWQNRGLGKTLFGKLVEIGRERGIERFFAEVLPENIPMLRVFHHSDCSVSTATEGDVVHVTIDLAKKPSAATPKTAAVT